MHIVLYLGENYPTVSCVVGYFTSYRITLIVTYLDNISYPQIFKFLTLWSNMDVGFNFHVLHDRWQKNPFFFSFIFIFGELYPNVLSTLWLIIEFECPLSVNNLDIFYSGCNLPLHPNIFFPKSKNSLFWKEFEHNRQRWEANVSHRIHEWLNENVSTGHRIPPEVFTTVQAIVTCLA